MKVKIRQEGEVIVKCDGRFGVGQIKENIQLHYAVDRSCVRLHHDVNFQVTFWDNVMIYICRRTCFHFVRHYHWHHNAKKERSLKQSFLIVFGLSSPFHVGLHN